MVALTGITATVTMKSAEAAEAAAAVVPGERATEAANTVMPAERPAAEVAAVEVRPMGEATQQITAETRRGAQATEVAKAVIHAAKRALTRRVLELLAQLPPVTVRASSPTVQHPTSEGSIRCCCNRCSTIRCGRRCRHGCTCTQMLQQNCGQDGRNPES